MGKKKKRKSFGPFCEHALVVPELLVPCTLYCSWNARQTNKGIN